MRRGAAAAVALMALVAGLPALGAPPGGARDPSQVLEVTGVYTVAGTEGWKSVEVRAGAVLRVPAGADLYATAIHIDGGSLAVDGGLVRLNAAPGRGSPALFGTALWLNLTSGARLSVRGCPGNASLEFSWGGLAAVELGITGGATLLNCTVEVSGGDGFSNPEPWVQGGDMAEWYVAAGGPAKLSIGEPSTPFVRVEEANLTVRGGRGGDAADGKEASGYAGGAGGGYTNGGSIFGGAGEGGPAVLELTGSTVELSGSVLTVQGGGGGDAGDGGGSTASNGSVLGGGGGGGYTGGDGGGFQPDGQGAAPSGAKPGGTVAGTVGAGGRADLGIKAGNATILDTGISVAGGSGGDAGRGGSGSAFCGGGGGGYGGGGGCPVWKGVSPPEPGNAGGGGGVVKGSVGAGGDAGVELRGSDRLEVSGLELAAQGGPGGTAGEGGGGGVEGGGGGGGFGGGGGGTLSFGTGGSANVSGETGAGGDASVEIGGGPVDIAFSGFVVMGGAGGPGGRGGPGGGRAGGGGAGFGGGGGAGESGGGFRAGTGTVAQRTGRGGDALLRFSSESGPGGLSARGNTMFSAGGAGGDGGPPGPGGGAGGGGGGHSGGGGMAPLQMMASGYVDGLVGNGGDAALEFQHPAPSLSMANSPAAVGGPAGSCQAMKGGGSTGGAGNTRTTARGTASLFVPMSTPRMVHPADGEISNSVAPTLEWEAVHNSTVAGEVIAYALQVDNNDDFQSPEIDTGLEWETSFTPGSEMGMGGTYYWRVMALYEKNQTTGWGPVRSLRFNTPPVLWFTIPLLHFPEDTTAHRLCNLSRMFKDDLFDNELNYTIIHETDPRHILAMVDGHFLTFTTPTKDWYGQERFAVRATDPLGLWANSNNFTVRVTPVDDPPSVSPVPDVTVVAGEEQSYDLSPYISDVDTPHDVLDLRTDSPYATPAGLAMRLLFPRTDSGGRVEFRVHDGNSSVGGSFGVKVLRSDRPPRLGEIPPVVTKEDVPLALELSPFVSDDNTPASEMRWSIDSIEAGRPPFFEASIVNRSVLLVAPAAEASGEGSLVLKAVDLDGRAGSRTVNVSVVPVNDPPVILPMAEVGILVGTNATVEVRIHDPDTPREELRLTCLSPHAMVIGHSLLVALPRGFTANRTTVHLRVSDGVLQTDYNLTVMARFWPVISAHLPDVRTDVGTSARLDLAAFVADQNDPPSPLSWSIVSPRNRHFDAYIDLDGSSLKIIPRSAGRENLTLLVRNRYNGTDSRTITVAVEDRPAPAPDALRWPATGAAAVIGAAVLFLIFRGRRPRARPEGPGPRRGLSRPPRA